MGKKKEKCECPDPGLTAPFYMLTYGDMMTLLLTFFVLLFSMSTLQIVKFQAQIGVIKGALGISTMYEHAPMQKNLPAPAIKVPPKVTAKPKIQVTDPETIEDSSQTEIEQPKQVEDQSTQSSLDSLGEAGDVQVTQSEDEINILLPTYGLFEKGQYQINPENPEVIRVKPLYEHLAQQIAYLSDYDIYVVGHTDSLPMDPKENGPQNNTELGFLRAQSVYDYFFKHIIRNPTRVIYASQGDNIPIIRDASVDSERRKNRRVELRLKKRVQTTNKG